MFLAFAVAALVRRLFQQFSKGSAEFRKVNPVLWPFGTGDAGLHIRQIQVDVDAVIDLAFTRHSEHVLGAEIIFERQTEFFTASGGAQVLDGFVVDWEIAHRRAVLGRHIADGGAIWHGQGGRAFAVKLDKFPDDFLRPQQLGDMQHEIGGRYSFAQSSVHMNAHHFGRQKVNRLSEHSGFGLNAADAPAHDTEPVDHCRVRIGADQGVWKIKRRIRPGCRSRQHALRQVFEVHLVHNANTGRDELECLEGLLSPLEKLVAFPVALEFHIQIQFERAR